MDSIVTTEDTIAAIASAISIGKGGVAIIRVSGKDAINSCKKIVQTKSKYAWESHRVFRGFIQENKQNKFIDEVLILVMKSPNSFTGEDVVELHCHGGIIIVNKVLKILLSCNFRRIHSVFYVSIWNSSCMGSNCFSYNYVFCRNCNLQISYKQSC